MNKRAIAILGAIFILIVGTLGFLIYSKYAGNKTSKTNTQATNQQGEQMANSGSGQGTANSGSTGNINAGNQNQNNTGNNSSSTPPNASNTAFVKLTDDQVVSPILFYNSAGVTYLDKQGQLFQADLAQNNGSLLLTQKRQLNIPQKAEITKILWPQKGNNFIAEISTSNGNTFSLYNSQTGNYVDFPPQVISVSWMPTGDKILYVWLQNGKAALNISNPDTTNWQQVADMWETDDNIQVSPDGSSVLYYEMNNQNVTNFINLTTPDGKIWKGLVKSGYNYGVLWSPDSQKFLFGKKDLATQQYQLWYYNLQTSEGKNLGLSTSVDKVVWAGDSTTIYAAVPQNPSNLGGSLTADNIVKLNTATLQQQQYPSSSVTIDADNLLLNSAESALFFRNAQDGGLYYLDLTR